MEQPYRNREIDEKFNDIKDALTRIEIQTTKHNGRMSKLERVVLVFSTVTTVLLMTNGSELIDFLKGII